jgi:spore coat protein U-like protein
MNKPILSAAALLLTVLWMPTASAAICYVSATGVPFGNVNPLTDTTVDSTGTITVFCYGPSSYTIKLNRGYSATYSPRQMPSGGNTMDYNLYQDASHLVIWGDGTGGSFFESGSIGGTLGSNNHTVYGSIPVSRTAKVGSYSDTITVTVTY